MTYVVISCVTVRTYTIRVTPGGDWRTTLIARSVVYVHARTTLRRKQSTEPSSEFLMAAVVRTLLKRWSMRYMYYCGYIVAMYK